MPIYEYKCEKGHVFDVIQKMSDEPLTECQECGAPAERVLHPVAVHFKGSGFYNTDYGKKKKKGATANGSSGEGSGESKGSESKSDTSSSDSKKTTESKTTTASASE